VTTERELETTSAFLLREFGAAKFADPAYLSWYYEANPDGAAVWGTRDDDLGRLATYALVRQQWRRGPGPETVERAALGITVNACVRRDAQRGGVFTALATEVFDAAAAGGVEGTLTIANANSTPAFVEKLGFVAIGSLPVRAVLPVARAASAQRVDVDDSSIHDLARDCEARGAPGWVHDWSFDRLRWRLANPAGEYELHRGRRVWCVSTRQRFGGIPIAVILALVPRHGATGVAADTAVAAACRQYRAPLAIYAGRNADVSLRGLPVPRRLLPAPLNLLARGFGGRTTTSLCDVATYEFLDTDHF